MQTICLWRFDPKDLRTPLPSSPSRARPLSTIAIDFWLDLPCTFVEHLTERREAVLAAQREAAAQRAAAKAQAEADAAPEAE